MSLLGTTRTPDALKVLEVMNSVFPNGMPLPGGKIITIHYRVSIKTQEGMQVISAYNDLAVTRAGSKKIFLA